MADKLAIMLELERRGALPEDKVELLAEARKRGLVSSDEQATPDMKLQDDGAGPEWSAKHPVIYGLVGAGKEVARFGAESAALIGGGMAGFAAGGPLGAVGGAGLAYGGVKAAERALEGEKATIPQAIKTSVGDVATGAGMEMGGQIAGKVIGGTLERISRPGMSDVPRSEIAERIAKAKEYGIELTPAEATSSKGLALYESMLDKSPFSTMVINTWRDLNQARPLIALREKLLGQSKVNPGQIESLGQQVKDQVDKFLSQFKELNDAQVSKLRDNVLKKLGTTETYESLGKTTQEAIATRSKAVYDKGSELYSAVGDTIPEGSTVKLTSTKKVATALLEQEMKKPPSLQNKQAIAVLRDISGKNDALLQEIEQYPEAAQRQILAKMEQEGIGGVDWKTAQSIRSELNSRIAQSDAAMKTNQPGAKFQSTPEAGIYKQLRKALDNDIVAFSDEIGGETKEAFDLANAFYREGKKVYNAPVLRRILSANPERVVDMIFRPNGGAEVDLVLSAVGREMFEKTLKPALTKRILDTGDIINPKQIEANLSKYGPELLAKVYNPGEIKMLRDMAKDGRIMLEEKLIAHPFLKVIASERPDVIVDSILGTSERMGNPKNLLKNVQTIRAIVDKQTFTGLQRELSDRLFRLNQITDMVQPERLSKAIQTNEKVLEAIYSPEQVRWLKEIADIGKRMASAEMMAKNPSGTAQNVVTWGTWGVILRSLKSAKVGETLSGLTDTIIAPKVMAKYYLSDAGRRYFTLGMKTPIGTKQGTEIATKLAEIGGINMVDKK